MPDDAAEQPPEPTFGEHVDDNGDGVVAALLLTAQQAQAPGDFG